MSWDHSPRTYDIDLFGDTILLLFQGTDEAREPGPEDDIAVSETNIEDAESIDTSIIDQLVVRRELLSNPDCSADSDSVSNPDSDTDSQLDGERDIHSDSERDSNLGGEEENSQENGPESDVDAANTIRSLPNPGPLRFKVSQRRLMRCSSFFRAEIPNYIGSPGAAEALNYTYVPIRNDNPTILALVLRVVHDKPGEIKQDEVKIHTDGDQTVLPVEHKYMDYIDLDALAQIATIVEKYKFHAGIEHCLHAWITNLWNYLEDASIADAIKWLWVTWVFHYADHFFTVTEYLVKNTTMSLQESTLEYDIPSHVLGE